MNDTDLDRKVREAFEREAASAPHPDGLLAAVDARRKKRHRARVGLTTVAVAACVVCGSVVGYQVWESVNVRRITPSGPAVSTAHNTAVCLTYRGGRVVELKYVVRKPDGSTVEQTTLETDAGATPRVPIERRKGLSMDIQLAPGSLHTQALQESRPVAIARWSGVLGDDQAGRRVLLLGMDVPESLLRLTLTADKDEPITDERLMDMARNITFDEGSLACD